MGDTRTIGLLQVRFLVGRSEPWPPPPQEVTALSPTLPPHQGRALICILFLTLDPSPATARQIGLMVNLLLFDS